ncbi:MAG: hypothetical protein M1840_001194 [Geoglossum simile]|nr:MAG: hypothetical protein M1840_001194 [Geoglossum simile]
MWQTLKDCVDTTSNANRPVILREQLHKEKYNGEGSVSTFIAKVLTYRDQLVYTPQALTDNEVASHLIMNLPSSWHIIKTIISNQPMKTLDSVTLALTNYEIQLQNYEAKEEVKPAKVNPENMDMGVSEAELRSPDTQIETKHDAGTAFGQDIRRKIAGLRKKQKRNGRREFIPLKLTLLLRDHYKWDGNNVRQNMRKIEYVGQSSGGKSSTRSLNAT